MQTTYSYATVPLTAHTLTLAILTYLIDRIDRGQFDELLGPLDADELDELRALSVRDLLGITSQGRPIVHISLDTRQLRGCMTRLRDRGEDESDQLWFVRRGAQQFLMAELFGTTKREFRDLRRHAGATDRGRPQALGRALAEEVQAAWRETDPRLNPIARYRFVGEAFPEVSLASLYAAIHDH